MNVLVVGGAGFIGHNVVQKFVSEGHTVSILDSMTTYNTYNKDLHYKKLAYRRSLMAECTFYVGDLTDDPLMVDSAFNEQHPDIVINLANVPVASIAVEDPIMASEAMVTGLLHLLKLSDLFKVKRFVNISSSMVYGDFSFDPQPETAGCHPKDIYGNLKLTGENLVRAYTHLHGLKHTIVRPSAVYGPTGNEMFVVTKFLRAALAGDPIHVNGSNVKLDFTYVSDLTEGIYLAATHELGINNTFNITSGDPRKLQDIVKFCKDRYPDLEVHMDPPDPLYPKRGGLDIKKAGHLLGYEPKVHLELGLALTRASMVTHDI